MLVREAVPEMIEGVKSGLAVDRNAKVYETRPRVPRHEDIVFAFQVAVGDATPMQRLDDLEHLLKKCITVADRRLSHGLGVDVLEDEVPAKKKTETLWNADDALQATINVVLTPQHPAIQEGHETSPGSRLDQNLLAANPTDVNAALVTAAFQSLTFSQAGKNVGVGETLFAHNLVYMKKKHASRNTAMTGSRFRVRLVLKDQ